jgi:hypothetical protein
MIFFFALHENADMYVPAILHENLKVYSLGKNYKFHMNSLNETFPPQIFVS